MFGAGELLVIVLVAIIVVDPKKLPGLMKSLGKALNEFKDMSSEVKRTIERETEASDFEERKAQAEEKLFGPVAAPDQPSPDHQPAAEGAAAGSGAEKAPAASAAAAGGESSKGNVSPAGGPAAAPEGTAAAAASATRAGEAPATAEAAAPKGAAAEPVPPASGVPLVAAASEQPSPGTPAPDTTSQNATAPDTAAAETSAKGASGPERSASEKDISAAKPLGSETAPAESIAGKTSAPAESGASAGEPPASEDVSGAQPPSVPGGADVPAAPERPAAAPAETEAAETPASPPSSPPPPPPTGDEAVGDGEAGRMSLFDHLQDLRKRLTRSAIAVLVAFLGCYAFAGRMLQILMQPMLDVLKQSHFIYTVPTEAFFTEMKVAFVAGIFVASPFIFYELWQFVAPGLYSHEKRWILPIAFFSAFFFIAGAMFGYFVVFPFGFEFFASYTSNILSFMPKLEDYLDFVLKLLFAFGVVFELPLFMFFLSRLGLVTYVGLRKKRKYAVLFSFVVAAALTPPDAVSQTMMAVPLCLLYEVGIWVAYFFGKRPKPEPKPEPEGGAGAA